MVSTTGSRATESRGSFFVNNPIQGLPMHKKNAVHPTDSTIDMNHIKDSENGPDTIDNLSLNQRIRIRVGYFMQLLYVELFFISLVVIYGGMVFVQMSLDVEVLESMEKELDTLDLVLGSALLIEIILKLYAFGYVYLKNCWNAFDAVVVILSFVLTIISLVYKEDAVENDAGVDDLSQSSILFRLLRLRVVLRLFRVLVVFERIKARSKAVTHLRMKGSIESPMEHVIRILAELRCHPGLHPRLKTDIEYCADIIKSNRLYDTGTDLLDEDMDADTQQWLKGEVMKSQATSRHLDVLEEVEIQKENLPILALTSTQQILMSLTPANETEFNDLMLTADSWTFDVFKAHEITNGHSLAHIGLYLFNSQGLYSSLHVDVNTVLRFLCAVQERYFEHNPYHNGIHGSDVMQTVNYFIQKDPVKKFLSPLDRSVALLAASIHDIGHDGVNNAFHIANADELAVRYNDISVLENFHVAQAFSLMRSQEGCNVFGNLSKDDFKYARGIMIDCVLGTDMSKHFEDAALFKTSLVPEPGQPFEISNVKEKRLMLKLLLHTSDVSNPAKERVSMLKWTDRVVEEFFRQGDKEREMNLPISPFMDRESCTLMKQQLGFIDYIVGPLFELWGNVIEQTQKDCLDQLSSNKTFWKECGESFTPADMKPKIKELTGEIVPDYPRQH